MEYCSERLQEKQKMETYINEAKIALTAMCEKFEWTVKERDGIEWCNKEWAVSMDDMMRGDIDAMTYGMTEGGEYCTILINNSGRIMRPAKSIGEALDCYHKRMNAYNMARITLWNEIIDGE